MVESFKKQIKWFHVPFSLGSKINKLIEVTSIIYFSILS